MRNYYNVMRNLFFSFLLLSASQMVRSEYEPQKSIIAIQADTLLRANELTAKVYGFAPFVLTNNVPGQNVIYTSSDTTIASISGSTVTIRGAGSTNISAQIEGNASSLVTKKLTIYKKTLELSTPSVWRPVGTPNPKFVILYDGFVYGETESVLKVKPVILCTASINSPIGEYSLTIMGGTSDNYSFGYNNTSKLKVVGVALEETNTSINLYPNPAIDKVIISGISKNVIVKINTLDGVTIKTLRVENGTFDVSELPKGLYLVEMIDGSERFVRKLRIE